MRQLHSRELRARQLGGPSIRQLVALAFRQLVSRQLTARQLGGSSIRQLVALAFR